MGISANQARLMTLTARQHDLELRAQSISAQKMVTSMESQQHATSYSTGLNNYSILKLAETAVKNAAANQHFEVDQFGNIKQTDKTSGTGVYGKDQLYAAVAAQLGLGDGFATDTATYLGNIKADYDLEMSKLSTQEKMLDMELTQINTEHNAVKTEYDAVKSLVSDNTEKSFNVFG